MTAPTLHRQLADALALPTVLNRAADLINADGWYSHGFGHSAVGWSVEGAIYKACALWVDNYTLDTNVTAADPRWVAATAALQAVAAHVDRWQYRPERAFRIVCCWSERCANPGTAVLMLRAVAAQARQETNA